MTRKLFVWDYHGVLEQGNERAVVEISNMALAEEHRKERITDDQVRVLYGRNWLDYFSSVLPKEPTAVHQALLDRARRISSQRVDIRAKHIRPTPYSIGVLTAIRATHDQVLISNCDHIMTFLPLTKMVDFFPPGKRFATAETKPPRTKQQIYDAFLADAKKRGQQYDAFVLIGDSASDLCLVPRTTRYLYAHPGLPFRKCEAEHEIRDLHALLEEI
jgi:hypothetical protein